MTRKLWKHANLNLGRSLRECLPPGLDMESCGFVSSPPRVRFAENAPQIREGYSRRARCARRTTGAVPPVVYATELDFLGESVQAVVKNFLRVTNEVKI